MSYFNYHAKAKRLIAEGKLLYYEVVESYHNISPALLLYFEDNLIMPIREHRFEEYFNLLDKL